MPQEQLAIIGAINVIWTRIERLVDTAMCRALNTPRELGIDLASRINGFDGKVALIKRGAELYIKMPQDPLDLLANSFVFQHPIGAPYSVRAKALTLVGK
jgi:hypothetical protein